MKSAFVFPGQGSQFVGMGKELYQENAASREVFNRADEILGFSLSRIMFEGSEEELKETRVTQPAIFLHSMAILAARGNPIAEGYAGHSLGEFSALVAAGSLTFEDGLTLVSRRALAMQEACDLTPGTMAAIVGLEDAQVEEICAAEPEVVVAANYNTIGQLVISGTVIGVERAVDACKKAGARMAVLLQVGGAFHSPLMEPARVSLSQAIQETQFRVPNAPVYQNVNAQPETDPGKIQANLVAQLTAPVMWTQIMRRMQEDGYGRYQEVGGNGKVLSGLFKRFDKTTEITAL